MKLLLAIFTISLLWLQPTAGLCQEAHPLGLNFTKHGVKNLLPLTAHPKYKAAPLPRAATIRQWYYRTNQKSTGICGPFSTMEVYDALYQRDHAGQHMVISALDLYQRVLLDSGEFPADSGVNNDRMLVIAKKGTLLGSTWPFVESKLGTLPPNTSANTKERSAHQVLKGYEIPITDGGFATRQCIANIKTGPILGTLWFNNGFTATERSGKTKDAKGNVITVKRFVVSNPSGSAVGGHDIPIISYDDDMQFPNGDVGGVEIHNHWQGWGDSIGAAWISYKWAFSSRYADDVIALETIDK